MWDAESSQRIYFVGNQYQTAADDGLNTPISNWPIKLSKNDQSRDVILRKTLSWEGFENYLRTWSPLVAYWAAHPNDKADGNGDIVRRFVRKLQEAVSEELGGIEKDEIELEFPVALIMIRKSL